VSDIDVVDPTPGRARRECRRGDDGWWINASKNAAKLVEVEY
jgi:hypothetical protein